LRHTLEQIWESLRFGALRVTSDTLPHLIEIDVLLGNLDPTAVRVELYAEAILGGDPVRQTMTWARELPTASSRAVYRTAMPATPPASDYSARVMPQRPGVAVPLKCNRIAWQR